MSRNKIITLILDVGMLISILVLVLVIVIRVLSNDNYKYEKEISDLMNERYEIVTENSDLKATVEDLNKEVEYYNKNIYNLFEKKPYELRVKNDKEYILYTQDKFGIFDSYSKMTVNMY